MSQRRTEYTLQVVIRAAKNVIILLLSLGGSLYLGYRFFSRYMIWKYFHSFCRSLVYSIDYALWCTNGLNLDIVQRCCFSFCYRILGIVFKKSLPDSMLWCFHSVFPSTSSLAHISGFQTHCHFPHHLTVDPACSISAETRLHKASHPRPFGMSPDSQFSLSFRDIISKSEVILKTSVKMGIPCCCCFPGCYPAFASIPLSTRKPFNFYQTISSVTHLPVSES